MFKILFTTITAVAHGSLPSTMRAVKATGLFGCKAPDFSCLKVETIATPQPKQGQVLIRVSATSVNPSDVDIVETPLAEFAGTLGNDASGIIVACPGCKRLKVGDAVWGMTGKAMADYAIASDESVVDLKPSSLNLTVAGTIPEVGLTSLFSLKATGAPWANKNLTVVVTSGSGGTGFMGIQLAKAYGAARVVTACGPENIDFVKSLGADTVVDYHKQDLFDFLGNDSVDIVYDNHGADGTADKAMHAIRSGGTYLLMPHGQCFLTKSQKPPCTAKTPKAGVTQINFNTGAHFGNPQERLEGLQEMKSLFEASKLVSHVDHIYNLNDIRSAYARSATGHIVGKIAVTTSTANDLQAGAVIV